MSPFDRPGLRAALVAGFASALVAVVPVPAVAHSQLVSSDPAAGASLDLAPAVVSLVFNEAVDPQFATVMVAVGGGAPAELPSRVQAAEVVADIPRDVAATSTAGQTTGWRVAYRVVSGDGHPVSGTVDFTVAAAPPLTTAPTTGPTPSPTASTSSPPQAAADAPAEAPESTPTPQADQAGGLSIGQVLAVAALALALVVGAVLLLARRRGRSS